MAFSLRQLRYFAAIAEHRSISAAASALAISQSTVTDALRDLELELGFDLAERRARGVELTLKGHQFLRHAHRILADVADARRALHEEQPRLEGRLALGVTRLVAGYALAELLARYRRAFPGVAVEVLEETGDYLEHLLVGGELDVTAMVLQSGSAPSALHVRTMEVSAQRAWLPLGHPAAEREPLSLRDLAAEPHVLLVIDEAAASLQTIWHRLGLHPPIAFRTGSVEAVRSLVATGQGVAVLPDLVYRPWSLEGDRIEARSIMEDLPAIEIAVAWRRGSTLSPAARGFVDLASTWRVRARRSA
ncbi:MAG TPA: LysR family transcriptional regulator [Acetobacteraceae bacterium]|nr:LysR family transcriptional regulator [Acetobacteraceae bacterium]